MTESTNHEPTKALFDLIRQMVKDRGVDIRLHQSGHALRLDFADEQRIVINLDPNTLNVWVAARSGGTEFRRAGDSWLATDRGELFEWLGNLIDQTIASDPVNARVAVPYTRQPILNPEPIIHYRAERKGSGLRNVLIVLLAGLFGFWGALKMTQQQQEVHANDRQNPELSLADPGQQCEAAFPASGSITFFPDGGLRADAPSDAEVTLRNDHAHPMLLILARPDTVIPSLSVLVNARESFTFNLPAGQYDMMFSVGNTWCNARRGFSDGHILKFDKTLTVETDKPVQLAAQSSGAGMEEFQLFVKTATPEVALPPPTFSGDGSMEVQRHPNGHFYLPGSIENVPVTFMVDTGASVTSISSEIADEAGIRNCKEMQFQTANGPATGCIALIANMTLGNFVLENITVAVMPNMETNLLGANVLRHYQVSQSDTVMLIGRR